MNLQTFLRLILPSEGYLCWVQIKEKRPSQGHVDCQNFAELETILHKIDNQQGDAYFGCASFVTNASRKADNALGAKAFWFDIDCGPGKDYPDIDTAITALDTFCTTLALPQPLLVKSGYGIHAWWPLDRLILKPEWVQHAKELQRLSEVHGLKVDSTRTADIASILRAPETHNHKNEKPWHTGHALVEIWDDSPDTFELISADHFISRLSEKSLFKDFDVEESKWNLERGVQDGDRHTAFWYLAGKLFARGLDDTTIYNMLAKWNALNNPPWPDDKLQHDFERVKERETEKQKEVGSDLPDLPGSFRWHQRQMLLIDFGDGTSEPKTITVSNFPVCLIDITKMEYKTSLAYIFKQWLPHGGWREFMIPAAEFESSGWFSHMAKAGADRSCITNRKEFLNYVSLAAAEIRRERMEAMRYEQFGWKDDKTAFLVGDVLFKTGGTTERAYVTESAASHARQFAVSPRASLDDWRLHANRLFSDDFLPLGFGLVASFCAPILGLCLNPADGGLALHYVSQDSGHGKSTTITAGASAWGQLKATRLTASDTLNAIFKLIATNCNIPIFIDELQQADPEVMVKFYKHFTVGEEKNRLNRDGSLQPTANTFQTILITTANFSMVEKLTASRDEGAIARVMEIRLNTPKTANFKELGESTKVMIANSGIASRHFLSAILQPGVIDIIRRQFLALQKEYGALGGSETRYISYLMAAIHVTAAILTQTGILQFDAKRLLRWMIEVCDERKNTKTSKDEIEILSEFISDYYSECLIVSGDYNPKVSGSFLIHNEILPRKINMRFVKDKGRLYFPISILVDWCVKKGYFYRDLHDKFTKSGVLLEDRKQVTLSAYTQMNTGRRWCWELNMNHPTLSGVLTDSVNVPIVEETIKGVRQ